MAFSSILYLWNKWNVRGLVILSLLLQVFLVLFAPFRKKMAANSRIIYLLWLVYLKANWIATFGIGLICNNQGNSSAHVAEIDIALRAFWVSFLLLHLGSPDTITAFSMEDSSLWTRHQLSLISQVGAVIYVFVQIFPSDKSLVLPTMLIFLAGVIKNVERILALKLSSLPRLREWMLSQKDKSDEPLDDKSDELVTEFIGSLDGYSYGEEELKLAESIVVKHAYYFFQISKVYLTDLIFTKKQFEMSVSYFNKVSAMDALRVISVELHFIYEVFHTKALTMSSKQSYIFRFIAFINVAMACILFNRLKKHQLPELDVKITYLLLFGGIALDVIAVIMLIFSDWTIAEIQWHKIGSSKLDSFLHNLVFGLDDLWKPRFATCEAEPNPEITYAVLDTPLLFRRWSESIYACNLLSESLEKSPRKMYKRDCRWANIAFSNICSFPLYKAEMTISCFHQAVDSIARGCGLRKMDGKRSVIANMRYVSTNPFIKKLWIFIFKEVRRKYIYANQSDVSQTNQWLVEKVKEIYEARGDWFLRTFPTRSLHETRTMYSITDFNYYESIIIWHVATEICYNNENLTLRNDEREFSKILSDYMLYLLFNQPNVMSAVAGIAQIRLADTLWALRDTLDAKNVKGLSEEIFSYEWMEAQDFDNSFLRWGTNMVYDLEELEKSGVRKWEVMSGVWVEILSYAASHIKGEAHAQVLSKGGELLTFVWLLTIHFGLFYRPEWAPTYFYRG